MLTLPEQGIQAGHIRGEVRLMTVLKDFTHLHREEHENCMHFSHLFQYVSAYEATKDQVEDLRLAIIEGLSKARKETTPVIVDQDGEMFIICNPSGSLSLCLRWKNYDLYDEEIHKFNSLAKPDHIPKPTTTEINLVAEAISEEQGCSSCANTEPEGKHCGACTKEAKVAIAAFLKARGQR